MMDLAYASGEVVTIQGFHASDDSLCNITATKKTHKPEWKADIQEGLHNHGGS